MPARLYFLAHLVVVSYFLPRLAYCSEKSPSMLRTREHYTNGPRTPIGAAQNEGTEVDSQLNATKQARFLLEEPTLPYVNDRTCSSLVGASALERHTAPMHGDVCRYHVYPQHMDRS